MIDSAILYFQNTFGVELIVDELDNVNDLPLYLIKDYEYKLLRLFDKSFILVHKRNNDSLNMSIINIHSMKIHNSLNLDYPILFVFDHLNTYLRKQLISERISFIIPGKMIFIFEIGSVFYERQQANYVNEKKDIKDKMTPSTQALFMYLITSDGFDRSMDTIAKSLNLTKMSVSRGFNELYRLGIIEKNEYEEGSRYRFEKIKKDVWLYAQKYMINPVIKTISVHKDIVDSNYNKFLISGESALAEISMLSSSNIMVYGITNKLFKQYKINYEELPENDRNSATIQLYKHDLPLMDGILHPLSIALVLKDEHDPRVRKEMDVVLDKYFSNVDNKWHKVMR